MPAPRKSIPSQRASPGAAHHSGINQLENNAEQAAGQDAVGIIVKDIVKKCHLVIQDTQHGQDGKSAVQGRDKTPSAQLTDALAAFILRSVVLDDANHFDTSKEMDQNEIDRLVNLCCQKMMYRTDPRMEICKFQVWFESNWGGEGMSERERIPIFLIFKVLKISMSIFPTEDYKIFTKC